MANEVYFRTWNEPSPTQIGPTMDYWTVVARLPPNLMAAGTAKRFAVFVKGTIGDADHSNPSSSNPLGGIFQVCLGTRTVGHTGQTGGKSLIHRANFGIRETVADVPLNAPQYNGIPFGFLCVQQAGNGGTRPAINGDVLGTTIDVDNWNSEIVLWARVAWNGDNPDYSATAVVADVQWLLFDMDELEANDHVRGLESTGVTIPGVTPTLLHQDPNDLGTHGDEWLGLGAHQQTGTFWLDPGPDIDAGVSETGAWGGPSLTEYVKTSQTRGNLALNPGSSAPEKIRVSMPWLFHFTRPAAGCRVTVRGTGQLNNSPNDPTADQITTLAVKIGELTDSNLYAGDRGLIGETITWTSPNPEDAYVPLERPSNDYLTRTTYFACARMGGPGGTSSHNTREASQIRILSGDGAILRIPQSFAWADGTLQEKVAVIAFLNITHRPVGAIQHRLQLVHRSNNPTPPYLWVGSWCSAYALHDPGNEPTGPWTEPVPVTLQIGREAVGALTDIPIAPDTVQQVSTEPLRFGELVSRQGYKRTWPTTLKARRTWALKWEPITNADAATLETFFPANPRFQFTPLGTTTAVKCALSGPIEVERLGDGRSIVRVSAVELIYTL